MDFSPQFLVNLPLLTEIFVDKVLEDTSADHLLNINLNVTLPKLPIEEKQYETVLISDETEEIDMRTAIEHAKNESKLYENLSHYLYSRLVATIFNPGSGFEFFSPKDWMLLFVTGAAAGSLVWLFVINHRLRAISLLVTIPRGANALKIPNLVYRPSTTTVLPDGNVNGTVFDIFAYSDQIKQLLPVDLTILFVILGYIVFILVSMLYRHCKQKNTSLSSFYIDISDRKEMMRIFLASFPYPPEYYTVGLLRDNIALAIEQSGFHTRITFGQMNVVIRHRLTDLRVLFLASLT